VLHPEVARRLSCDCRLQAVLKDPQARALGIGRRSRSVPSWLMRQLLERDRGCTFPGCHTRRFISAHPHPALVEGRAHRPLKPRGGVQLPPQAGPRRGLEGAPRRRPQSGVAAAQWRALRAGPFPPARSTEGGLGGAG
jgi:hypothetical protein